MKNIKKRILLIVSILSVSLCLKLQSMDQQEDTHMQDAQSNSMEIVPVTSNTSSSNSLSNSGSAKLNQPVDALNLLPEEIWAAIIGMIQEDSNSSNSLRNIAKTCRPLLRLVLTKYHQKIKSLPLIKLQNPINLASPITSILKLIKDINIPTQVPLEIQKLIKDEHIIMLRSNKTQMILDASSLDKVEEWLTANEKIKVQLPIDRIAYVSGWGNCWEEYKWNDGGKIGNCYLLGDRLKCGCINTDWKRVKNLLLDHIHEPIMVKVGDSLTIPLHYLDNTVVINTTLTSLLQLILIRELNCRDQNKRKLALQNLHPEWLEVLNSLPKSTKNILMECLKHD
jgi:hypothetical protein